MKRLILFAVVSVFTQLPCSAGDDVLFEDSFDTGLSDRWELVGLDRDDIRIVDGALEVRVKANTDTTGSPMLQVHLPFTTEETVQATVEVHIGNERLQQGEQAGLCLTKGTGAVFTVRKTNIDGYSVFAPGMPEFIGQPGQEGNPDLFKVTYWPSTDDAGPVRIIVRGDYAYFQTGPSSTGEYRTMFHSAIQHADEGLGFGLTVAGETGNGERRVRFDNFRVTR